jgi:hypothetical protein
MNRAIIQNANGQPNLIQDASIVALPTTWLKKDL